MSAMVDRRMHLTRTLMLVTGIAVVVLSIGVYMNGGTEVPVNVADSTKAIEPSELLLNTTEERTKVASFVKADSGSPLVPGEDVALPDLDSNIVEQVADSGTYQPPANVAPMIDEIDPSSLLTDDAQDAIAEIVTGPVSPDEEKEKLADVLSQMEELGGPLVEKELPGRIHVVQMGETISDIALEDDVSASNLMKANNIKNPLRLQLGRELKIP